MNYLNACPALHWDWHRLSSASGACPALMGIIIFNMSCVFLFGINFGWQTSGIMLMWSSEYMCACVQLLQHDRITIQYLQNCKRHMHTEPTEIQLFVLHQILNFKYNDWCDHAFNTSKPHKHNTWNLQTRCATCACMHAWPHEHSG